MSYVGLGARSVTAAAGMDDLNMNPGNWTASFTPARMSVTINNFELYHAVITAGPAGSTFTVSLDLQPWSGASRGDINEWDPSQPLLMNASQTLYFYWNAATSTTPAPQVTIWLRYDPDTQPVL
jgi:hypothetical protein